MTNQHQQQILVVDDNFDNRELVAKVLKHKGYSIIEAIDGEEALEKAELYRPALILMDISIPKLDGYEATRRLRQQEKFNNTPIVAMTAHAMKGDREKAIAAGCDGYIAKPVDIKLLADQVKSFLNRD